MCIGVRWAVHVRSCLDLGKIEGSRNTDPAGATRTDRLHIFHHYKLVFHLRVTITIKGETQMGSVSNKDSMGY